MEWLYEKRKKELKEVKNQIKILQKKRKKLYDYINLVDYRANNKSEID